MTTFSFELQFAPEQIQDLAAKYDDPQDAAALKAGENIIAGLPVRENLRIIFRWKTNGRGISRLERNSETDLDDAVHLASQARSDRSAVAVLTGLYGVDVPVASAILTSIFPERFTVIDFRALEALGKNTKNRSVDFYLQYLTACREIAAQNRVTLRTLDRALWQWSKDRKE